MTIMKRMTLVTLALLAFPHLASSDETIVALTIDEIREDSAVLDGRDYVSTGQPDEEILRKASDAGFVAVIDMRTASEDRGYDEAATVETLGMSYISLPVAGADDTSFENAAQLDEILAGIDGPVLLHCASGNRVGALFALRASLAGASDEEALAVGKAAGLTRLEETVKERLAAE